MFAEVFPPLVSSCIRNCISNSSKCIARSFVAITEAVFTCVKVLLYFKAIWDKGSTIWHCICKTMLFAVVFPVFVTDEVNVIVSPSVAKFVLAFLFKTKVASIIGSGCVCYSATGSRRLA